MKHCESCGVSLAGLYPNRKYCSAECMTYLPQKKCEVCHGLFKPLRSQHGRYAARFCSRTCASHWAAKNKQCTFKTNKACLRCGTPMVGVHHQRNYCSVACRSDTKILPCYQCGKGFASVKESPAKARKRFCSRSCKAKATGRTNARRHVVPTAEEMAVWQMFPESISHFHIRTGRKRSNGSAHWYQLDIAFPNVKLAVEIDGGIHNMPEKVVKDQIRTEILESLGWTVLRFSNLRVTNDLTGVGVHIRSTISRLTDTQATQSTG